MPARARSSTTHPAVDTVSGSPEPPLKPRVVRLRSSQQDVPADAAPGPAGGDGVMPLRRTWFLIDLVHLGY
jgi:hypothetical protein